MEMFSILDTETGNVKLYHNIAGISLRTLTLMVETCARKTTGEIQIVLDKPLERGLKDIKPVGKKKFGVNIPKKATKAYLKAVIHANDLGIKHTRMGRDKMHSAILVALEEKGIKVGVDSETSESDVPLVGTVLVLTGDNINEISLKLSQAVQKKISFVVTDYYKVVCGFISKASYEKEVCTMPTTKMGF